MPRFAAGIFRDTIERLKDCPEVERWGLSQNYYFPFSDIT